MNARQYTIRAYGYSAKNRAYFTASHPRDLRAKKGERGLYKNCPESKKPPQSPADVVVLDKWAWIFPVSEAYWPG